MFNDFFDTENEEKYYKQEARKKLFTTYMTKFYYVLFLVFIQKTSVCIFNTLKLTDLQYFFAKKNMHPLANRTIYRMKELIHKFSLLRRRFYHEGFKQVKLKLVWQLGLDFSKPPIW